MAETTAAWLWRSARRPWMAALIGALVGATGCLVMQ